MPRSRQFVAWFFIAATVWMGTGQALHALSHALHALETPQSMPPMARVALALGSGHDHSDCDGHGHAPEDGRDHGVLCEQCALFSAMDGAGVTRSGVSLPALPGQVPGSALPATARNFRFTAYTSRAPPHGA
ncbi:MAG: hypothetical protein U1F04_08150 [Burkholderiaceae bacterium]|jgi:hypothetical protein